MPETDFAALRAYLPVPVSYTHLDVYKRQVCYKDLDEGLLMGLEMTIEEMTEMVNPVHHATIEARDALKG